MFVGHYGVSYLAKTADQKIPLGLWNYPVLAFLLEAGLLFGGMWLYFRATEPVTADGRYAMPVFGIVMLLIQASVFFGPPPPSPSAAAMMALVSYVTFAWVAHWLERKRR